jgi:hypothetical protein
MQAFLLTSTENALGFMWIVYMSAAVFLMFAFIYFSCDISVKDAGYCTIHAFVLAEFAASFEWQIHVFIWPASDAPVFLSMLLLAVIYISIFVGAGLLIKHFVKRGVPLNVTGNQLFFATIIGISVFAISNLSFMTTETPFSGHYNREIFNIRTITDLCGLILLGAYNLARNESRAKGELDTVQRILRSQYEQYQLSKDSLEHINRKHHDIKHQIAVLRAEEDSKRRADFLDKMEKEITIYEAQYKTGNSVIDTILSGKALYCANNDIVLTCVANGVLLDFMDVIDICTVIGNALDNAIEHVVCLADKEKRLIHVKIFSMKGLLIIRFENYMEGTLNYEGNLPLTTKTDSDYHGYGLKSVRFVAEKYKGTMSVVEKNSWFYLEIVIPLEK